MPLLRSPDFSSKGIPPSEHQRREEIWAAGCVCRLHSLSNLTGTFGSMDSAVARQYHRQRPRPVPPKTEPAPAVSTADSANNFQASLLSQVINPLTSAPCPWLSPLPPGYRRGGKGRQGVYGVASWHRICCAQLSHHG